MAFDGFITKSIVIELQNTLLNAKINKVLQPSKNEIILQLYNGENYSLLISTNPNYCRLNITNFSKPNPQNAFNFCMLLRKYLIGAKIKNISTYDLERTVEIDFECYNELNDLVSRKLYVEIMSRQSNIILVNEDNIIIDTLKHYDNSRELLPAHEYIPVPSTKKSFLTLKNFEEFINGYNIDELESYTKFLLDNYIGFSKPLILEGLKQVKISNEAISIDNLKLVYEYFKKMVSSFGTNNNFCKKISDKEYSLIYNPEVFYDYDESENQKLDTNYFIDTYYYNKESNDDFNATRNSLLKVVSSYLKKIYKKIENINSKLKECENIDTYKLYGELITANLYRLDNSFNYESIEVENYYDNNNKITIPLDKSISVQKNVEKYFKKYNKLKNALSICSDQKKDAEKELNYIETIVFNLSNATTLRDLNEVYEEIYLNVATKKDLKNRNQNNSHNPKHNIEKIQIDATNIDDFKVYIGKNNIQNDYISLKFSNPNDIWFHAQKLHGSHVLLKNPDNLDIDEIPENVLFQCAKLAKENSKASNSLNVPIDYCYAKYVKKASGAKPGMVIYNNFKTIIVK